jgi:hypothetical protein
MVAQAVAGQRLAEERMEDANEAAAEMAGDARSFARRHSRAVGGGAATDPRLDALRRAWDDASAALTRLDAQKEQARREVAAAGREEERGEP